MDEMHEFWAGLVNMDKGPKPWCTMDCRRVCDDRVSCNVVKTFCNRDVEAVRAFAERWLREMRE